jgi:hypothetical protein
VFNGGFFEGVTPSFPTDSLLPFLDKHQCSNSCHACLKQAHGHVLEALGSGSLGGHQAQNSADSSIVQGSSHMLTLPAAPVSHDICGTDPKEKGNVTMSRVGAHGPVSDIREGSFLFSKVRVRAHLKPRSILTLQSMEYCLICLGKPTDIGI